MAGRHKISAAALVVLAVAGWVALGPPGRSSCAKFGIIHDGSTIEVGDHTLYVGLAASERGTCSNEFGHYTNITPTASVRGALWDDCIISWFDDAGSGIDRRTEFFDTDLSFCAGPEEN